MDVAYLPEYMNQCLVSGVTLSTEQMSLVQNSLRVLQEQARFCQMYFWGILYATGQDYYVAFGVRHDALDRIFYYSLDGLTWLLLPDPVSQPNAPALTLECRLRFAGDPMLLHLVPAVEVGPGAVVPRGGEGDGDKPGEGLYGLDEQGENTEAENRELKEEDRLAVVVKSITDESFVLPRRALFKVPNKIGSVVFNKYFQGLNESEAMRMQNYVHYREPRAKWNMNLVESSAANYSTDFLDPVNEDIPKNKSWALLRSYDNTIVFSRSLFWHGSMFFHLVDTPLYGNCYFGYGLKNYDLPFMLSPTIP